MILTELVEKQRLVHQVTKLEQQRNELKWQVEYWQEQAVYWRRMGMAMCIGCSLGFSILMIMGYLLNQ